MTWDDYCGLLIDNTKLIYKKRYVWSGEEQWPSYYRYNDFRGVWAMYLHRTKNGNS